MKWVVLMPKWKRPEKNLSLNAWFELMTCVIVAYTSPLRFLSCPFKHLSGFVRASDKYCSTNPWNISFIVSLWCQFNLYWLVWYQILVFTSPPKWNLPNLNLSYFSAVQARIFHASFAIVTLGSCWTVMIGVTWYICSSNNLFLISYIYLS